MHSLLVEPYLLDTPLFDGGVPFVSAGPFLGPLLRWLLPPLKAACVADRIVRDVIGRKRQRRVIPVSLFLYFSCAKPHTSHWSRTIRFPPCFPGGALGVASAARAAPDGATRSRARSGWGDETRAARASPFFFDRTWHSPRRLL